MATTGAYKPKKGRASGVVLADVAGLARDLQTGLQRYERMLVCQARRGVSQAHP